MSDVLDKVQLVKDISEKVSTEMQAKMDAWKADINRELTEAKTKVKDGLMTTQEFETFKTEKLAEVTTKLEQLDEVTRNQGTRINAIAEEGRPGSKSFESYLIDQFGQLKTLRTENKSIEIPISMMRKAGVMSIGTGVQSMDSPPGSPYAPGIGGETLEFFDIVRNPNYIINKIDLGRTDRARLAWINETGESGTPTEVTEGSAKPQIDNTFKVEFSAAKKIAAYYEVTEEFEEDLPQLATIIRRMLQERVLRAWDDVIQTAVQSVATAYSMPGLAGSIPFANYWDAIYSMMAQVRTNNFVPNSVGINPQTDVKMQADKNSEGSYLLPPFKDEIVRMLTQANKISVDNAFVGDLKQFKVDIYKEFVIKMGWINDNFINNKFVILGEMRYHRYISDNRKKAIVAGNLGNIRATIDGGSGS